MSSLRVSSYRFALSVAACATLVALAGAGCGAKGKPEDVVLAKVGDKEITVGYYEQKLTLLNPQDLPRDDKGQLLDMAQTPGKAKFLESIINKDVMVAMARKVGLDADPRIETARQTLISFESVGAARERYVNKPASEVSEQDILAYYENFGRIRKCRYLITNLREDAVKAREQAVAGADWDNLFREFHDGLQKPGMSYKIDVPYGRFIANFEDPIFATKVGDITEPVPSAYGWWVLKVDSEEQGKKPPLEEARNSIKASIITHTQMRLIDAYKEEVHKKYKMYVREDALMKAYEALPPDESLFYPGTTEAVKREDLAPLKLDPRDMDMDFYGYEVKGEPRKYTLGDFKAAYDRMNVFERPKWAEMVGGLKMKVTDEIDRALLNFDAQDRGLDKDPEVLAKVDEKVEQMLVQKLYDEGITYDKNVRPAALDSAWALLKDQYNLPETRSGKRIVFGDKAAADQAYAALSGGMPWRKAMNTFGVKDTEAAGGAQITGVRQDSQGPERDALFSLQVDKYSQPFAVGDGRWEIVLLEGVDPPRSQTMEEVAEVIVKRIHNSREEEAFKKALEGWKKQVPVVIHEDRLAKARSWKELTDAAKQPAQPAGK